MNKIGSQNDLKPLMSLHKEIKIERLVLQTVAASFDYYKGMSLLKDGSIQKAVAYIKSAADAGLPQALNQLGHWRLMGENVPKDEQEAVRLFKLAADQGYAPAQNSLGYCYYQGTGINKDLSEAVRLYTLAAVQKYDVAQYNLGHVCEMKGCMYQAMQFYQLAADQGHAGARKSLTCLYFKPDSIDQDISEIKKAISSYQIVAGLVNLKAINPPEWASLVLSPNLLKMQEIISEVGETLSYIRSQVMFLYEYINGDELIKKNNLDFKSSDSSPLISSFAADQVHKLAHGYFMPASVDKDIKDINDAMEFYTIYAIYAYLEARNGVKNSLQYLVEAAPAFSIWLVLTTLDYLKHKVEILDEYLRSGNINLEKVQKEELITRRIKKFQVEVNSYQKRLRTMEYDKADFRIALNYFFSAQYYRALAYFDKASQYDYPPSYLFLFNIISKAREHELAETYYQSAKSHQAWFDFHAQEGDPEAQFYLGYFYEHIEKDIKQAIVWYRRAAEKMEPMAQNNLGVCYRLGQGVDKDEREAVVWYRRAAEQGHPAAQNRLGVCYRLGQGVDKDDKEAVVWYRRAAEQGHPAAQNNLGVCYRLGRGVTKDEKEAVAWYRKAAEQRYSAAQNNLGICYDLGIGGVEDEKEAATWYREAAERGHPAAQNNLGDCYALGRGVTKDEKEAVVWYRKAAEQGNSEAQTRLAECYENGQGVIKNEGEAISWYQRADEQGSDKAKSALSNLLTRNPSFFSPNKVRTSVNKNQQAPKSG